MNPPHPRTVAAFLLGFLLALAVISFLETNTSIDLKLGTVRVRRNQPQVDESPTNEDKEQLSLLPANEKDNNNQHAEDITWFAVNPSNPLYPKDILCQRQTGYCQRKCPNGINNKILYMVENKAGLNDRCRIFSWLVELAGYLCARVYLPRPYILLGKGHNRGDPLSEDLTWSDFIHYTFHDGTSAIEHLELTGTEDGEKLMRGDWFPIIQKQETKDSVVLLTAPNSSDNGMDVTTSFLRALSISTSSSKQTPQASFVWDIRSRRPFLDDENAMERLFQKELNHTGTTMGLSPRLVWEEQMHMIDAYFNLSYVVADRSSVIMDIARDLWSSLQKKYPGSLFGSWHIRRADTRKVCDTTLKRMRRFVECTFSNIGVDKRLVVLLMTDDQHPRYLQGLKDIFSSSSNATRGNVELVLVDELVQNHLEQLPDKKYNNNYHQYEIDSVLVSKATAFRLQHRRKFSCEDCANLQDML